MDDIADLMFTTQSAINNDSNNSAIRKGHSSFDYLSASIARSSSSASSHHHPVSRTISSSQPSPKPQPSPGQQKEKSKDAFSSLFGEASSAACKPVTSNMTIAQRIQAAQNQQLHQQLTSASATSKGSGFSAYPQSSLTPNLTSAARSISPMGSQPPASMVSQNHQLMSRTSSESWDFDLLEKPQNAARPLAASELPGPSSHPQYSTKRDSWGIDPLSNFDEVPHPTQIRSTQNDTMAVHSLLGDEFDPVEAPDESGGSIALPDGPESDEDILGLLGAPIDQVHADRIKQQANSILQESPQAGPSTRGQQQSQSKSSSPARIHSPPPHILGQVVEIGFSPARSRQALVQTRNPKTGDWDVTSAVESLLGTQSRPASREQSVLDSRSSSEPARRKPHGPPPANNSSHETGPAKSELTSNIPGVNTKEIQDQAAELLAQASAYGTTALGKAASFWKQGKASLTKVIEEQTGSSRNAGVSKDGDVLKPKWMKDAEALSAGGEQEKQAASLAPFSDDSKSDQRFSTSSPKESNPISRQPYVSSARRQVTERTLRRNVTAGSSSIQKASTGDLLFSSDAGLPSSAPPPPRSISSGAPPAKEASISFNFPKWPAVTGNELFKQGQYGNAEAAYTQALDVLQDPAGNAQNVYFGTLPLYNNRAAARFKNGDGKGARSDVERVIEALFCEDSQLSKPLDQLTQRLEWNQTRLPAELKERVNITEQLGKALSKRARINEDCERWDEAKRDWEECRRLGLGVVKGAGGMKIVNESLARCSKAVSRPPGSTRGGQPIMKASGEGTRKLAERIGAQRGNEAVARLRVANEKIEEEENQRLEAKDMVDEKIARWKAGKESNLRALLASLDVVLWEGLQWKKVSMAELLTEGQVKSKYVRAISKVHPDKIPKDATVAEQMVAKSVSTPTLPHDIIAAAHCLAPLDDLHLAHLINDLKQPTTPYWNLQNQSQHNNNNSHTPLIESNDRLRSDELADLPAPDAERLHAAYDIEDHLDSTPDRLLVFGPATPLIELLKQVKQLLIKKKPSDATLTGIHNKTHHHLNSSSSSSVSRHLPNHVYVARVWFQPQHGPEGSYKWEKGGPDLFRFELAHTLQDKLIIKWSPVEVALSQALEVGHQLLALLHSRQFSELLGSMEEPSAEDFRAINPIVWLVDPVEYAHAQLRETTEWGWSEHHVELNALYPPPRRAGSTSCPTSSNSSFTSMSPRDYARHPPKSHLSQEVCPLDHQSPPPDPHPVSSASLPQNSKIGSKNLIENLPSWLDDLLVRRLPRLLSLPDGCLSYELLNSTPLSSNPPPPPPSSSSRPPAVPITMSSPPSDSDGQPEGYSPLISKVMNSRWSALSVLGSPSRPFGLDQRSMANSVPSFDQHYIPSPALNGSLRHGQTNTLRYYPCKACAEHAFKLALSHKLNEEKRRALPRSNPMRHSRSSHVHSKHQRSKHGGSTGNAASDWAGVEGGTSAACQAKFPCSINAPQSFSAVIDTLSSSSPLQADFLTSIDAASLSAPPIDQTEPVIGLGLKGKALKEAMDREHDDFIKNHYSSLLSASPIDLPGATIVISDSSKHAWDEGETVDD
ncbi:hypothetical protein VP01_797g2 [Puccinia sorghi]|uniref:J domain-containing protein n=1 Tax=Puccinia sorghi TaxID=27349 RepID=A0A0L6UCS4_9BASI|nr:hypothetical protein VP01_797g2 [Puccinia sorghi]